MGGCQLWKGDTEIKVIGSFIDGTFHASDMDLTVINTSINGKFGPGETWLTYLRRIKTVRGNWRVPLNKKLSKVFWDPIAQNVRNARPYFRFIRHITPIALANET